MPLPLPHLDDRRWADLVDEGRALIPRYAPEWTDHNVHDPGVTLMELFAWLTEMNVYRLNRVPDRHRRKFLALIGYSPQPPRAAQSMLTLEPEVGTDRFSLPKGTEVEATDSEAHPIRFRTLRDLDVAVVQLTAILVEAQDGSRHDLTRDWRDGLPIAVLGQNLQPGVALYLGFSEIPTGVPVALALHFEGPGNDTAERARLVQETAAQHAARSRIMPELPSGEKADAPPQLAHTLLHHSARLIWQVSTSGTDGWTGLKPVRDMGPPQVEQVRDDTRALTLDGIVELNLPPTAAPVTLKGVAQPSLVYLRCQLATGAYDAPPLLKAVTPNSVAIEQAVPVFQTFTIVAGVAPVGDSPAPGTMTRFLMQVDDSGRITALSFLAPAKEPSDVPEVVVLSYTAPAPSTPGQITMELVLVGRGNGRPEQSVQLPQAPVHVESFQLYTLSGHTWRAWTRRDDFDASRRTHCHVVIEPVGGEITFGDGERGCVPSSEALIFVAYRTTRASMGNVAAGAVMRPANTPRNARWHNDLLDHVKAQLPRIMTNCVPACGGTGVETVTEAVGRAVNMLYAHERLLELCAETQSQTLDQIERERVHTLLAPTRAVNLLDIERLALDVPGTRVVRARAWAGVHPDYPCLQTSGVVTVVVVPDLPSARPQPSPGLLTAVRRYLDRRRIVCTRLEVVGPTYVEVRVRARVRARPHTNKAEARKRIRQALDAFFNPRTGGPAKLGWPFGRDVYRSEILQVIDGVLGVDHVLELTLTAATGEPSCGNVSLCPTWLVTPGKHQIEVV